MLIALLPIVALIALLLLIAELLAAHQERVIDAEGEGWREGFETARGLTRSTARRWEKSGGTLEALAGRTPPGKGPGLV